MFLPHLNDEVNMCFRRKPTQNSFDYEQL